MNWLDATSPVVRSAVVSGGWGAAPHSTHGLPVPTDGSVDTIETSLAAASDILSRRTGFSIHPAGTAEEDYIASPRARRLTPSYQPLRTIVSLSRLDELGGPNQAVLTGWFMHSGALYFGYRAVTLGDYYRYVICTPPGDQEFLRLKYTFGSTITASARRAVITLAHQIWLESSRCDDCDECQLPATTTAVAREGISYTMGNIDLLDGGRTGLPGVDSWVAGVNPRQATRRSAVYDPGAPPGVIHSLQDARPAWVTT